MEGDDGEPFFLVKEMPLSLVEPGHQNSFGWDTQSYLLMDKESLRGHSTQN